MEFLQNYKLVFVAIVAIALSVLIRSIESNPAVFDFSGEREMTSENGGLIVDVIDPLGLDFGSLVFDFDSAESVDEKEKIENDAQNVVIRDEETDENASDKEVTSAKADDKSNNIDIREPEAIVADMDNQLSPDELRIGFVTDIHAESSIVGGVRLLDAIFVDRLNFFLRRMQDIFHPNVLVVNGDTIDGTKRSSDVGVFELRAVKSLFSAITVPVYWALGNHDLRSVTKEQWKSALGIRVDSKGYAAFDYGNYRIFVLDSNFTPDDEDVRPKTSFTRGKVSEKQIDWLRRKLKEAKDDNKRSLVFIHNPPLWNVSVKINDGLLLNAQEIRDIFEKYDVLAVFSGHIEDVYYEKSGGVKYFVLPGLVKNPDYPGTFAEIVVKGGSVEVDMQYQKQDGTYRTVRMK